LISSVKFKNDNYKKAILFVNSSNFDLMTIS
jgi:hypothetical protein